MAIKINKKWENSIANNTLVSVAENTQEYDNQPAEKVIQWLSYSHVNNVNKNIDDLYNYLRYLDAKISSVRKTATLWDAYNIRTSVQTSEEFYQKYINSCSANRIVYNKITKTKLVEQTGYNIIHIDEYEWINNKEYLKEYLTDLINNKSIFSLNNDIEIVDRQIHCINDKPDGY